MLYPASSKAEKHPLTESCLPNKFSILSLSRKNKISVKNKNPAVSPTALWSDFFQSWSLSCNFSLSYFALWCWRWDSDHYSLLCQGIWMGTRRSQEKGYCLCLCHPTLLLHPGAGNSFQERWLVPVCSFPSIHKPASSLPTSDAPMAGQLAALLWTELCPQNSSVDPLAPNVTMLKFGLLGSN